MVMGDKILDAISQKCQTKNLPRHVVNSEVVIKAEGMGQQKDLNKSCTGHGKKWSWVASRYLIYYYWPVR